MEVVLTVAALILMVWMWGYVNPKLDVTDEKDLLLWYGPKNNRRWIKILNFNKK